jgi:hypothetical protein
MDMIRMLPEAEGQIAAEFAALAHRLGCTAKVRYAAAHKSWKCVYRTKNPPRVLFTLECTPGAWHIKACLFHTDRYDPKTLL